LKKKKNLEKFKKVKIENYLKKIYLENHQRKNTRKIEKNGQTFLHPRTTKRHRAQRVCRIFGAAIHASTATTDLQQKPKRHILHRRAF
jgi:hypothetical protein